MKIKILFDKTAKSKKLHIGWGVSFLINNKILFDTGENGSWLLDNMRNLNVDISKIEAVVISHEHWDHAGGLWELLKKKKGLTVYACPNFSAEFKKKVKRLKGKLVETRKVAEVSERIFVTGEIAGEYEGEYMPEQAIIVKTKKGLTVITGCAHPGIIKIVEKVRKKFFNKQLYLVFGGFHLMGKSADMAEAIAGKFKKLNVQKAGPTHCSGEAAKEIFKKKYGNDFITIKTGRTLNV